jgi:cystathionine beta-lyase
VPDLGACSLEALRARTSEKWSTHPADVLPAFIAEMDFDVADTIRQSIVAAVHRSDLGYPYPTGLGAAFAGFAGSWWGWDVDAARVHAAPDVMTGVATMLAACTPAGSGVVINPPVYPPFFFRLEQSERLVVPVPLKGTDLDLDAVDAALAAPDVSAYLLCSPHNPLGRVWRREELLAVAEMCWQRQVLLLVDEIHSPLVMEGAEFVPFLSLDHPMVERSVVFHSASKGWNVPGLKCGLVVTGSAALSRVVEERWEALFPSQLGVVGTEAAYGQPEAHAWLRSVVAQLEANRTSLGRLLAAALPDVGFTRPEASFLVWLDCRALGFGDDPAATFLERGRVALSPGPAFGEAGRGHARLNMGTSSAILEEIVGRLGAAVTPS